MIEKIRLQQSCIEQSLNHIHVELDSASKVISSAVLNGGMVKANHLLNLHVNKNRTPTELPDEFITKYASNLNLKGAVVGMMTAAYMDTFRLVKESMQGVEISVLVTCGLSNARRVGDRAEYRVMAAQEEEIGTINIIVLTSAILTDAAMVEALMIATEAKTAALQETAVLSPVSNKIATGTGTDAIAVVSGQGPELVAYCGKHVLFGETLGSLVFDAVKESIKSNLNNINGTTPRSS